MKKIQYIEVEYGELEDIIYKEYELEDRMFSIPADLEASNDTKHSFDIDGNLHEDDEEELKEFIESKGKKGYYITQILMNDLARKGILEKGTYLINISW